MNSQAVELNGIIMKNSNTVFELLSERGRKIYFPKKGILSQSQEAKGKKINATIGEAVSDDGSPMFLQTIQKGINVKPEEEYPYAPSIGIPDLRSKWKEFLYEKNPSLKDK